VEKRKLEVTGRWMTGFRIQFRCPWRDTLLALQAYLTSLHSTIANCDNGMGCTCETRFPDADFGTDAQDFVNSVSTYCESGESASAGTPNVEGRAIRTAIPGSALSSVFGAGSDNAAAVGVSFVDSQGFSSKSMRGCTGFGEEIGASRPFSFKFLTLGMLDSCVVFRRVLSRSSSFTSSARACAN
jgi:hypothetical protein